MSDLRAKQLIRELLANPREFDDEGRAYQLLQEYFDGLSLMTLRPLLAHRHPSARRSASFIVSELGIQGKPLIDEVIPLIHDPDIHTKSYAYESLIVCSVDDRADRFFHMLNGLQDGDWRIRKSVMYLVTNSDESQIRAGIDTCHLLPSAPETHRTCLYVLLLGKEVPSDQILAMIADHDPLVRAYGGIAAKRLIRKRPELIRAAADCADPDVARFARQAIEDLEAG